MNGLNPSETIVDEASHITEKKWKALEKMWREREAEEEQAKLEKHKEWKRENKLKYRRGFGKNYFNRKES